MINKNVIDVNIVVSREDGKEIDLDQFLDDFIEWIENKKLLAAGSYEYHEEEE